MVATKHLSLQIMWDNVLSLSESHDGAAFSLGSLSGVLSFPGRMKRIKHPGKISRCFVGCRRLCKRGDNTNDIEWGIILIVIYYYLPLETILGDHATISEATRLWQPMPCLLPRSRWIRNCCLVHLIEQCSFHAIKMDVRTEASLGGQIKGGYFSIKVQCYQEENICSSSVGMLCHNRLLIWSLQLN